jgi:DNA-directed RNA polymerase subunit RPC12/RpoP
MDFKEQVAYLCWGCKQTFFRRELHAIRDRGLKLVCSKCLADMVADIVYRHLEPSEASAYKRLMYLK